MAYYRIGEEIERPRYWLAIVIAVCILFAALFFSYGFIAIGVSAHYHPTSDIFAGALAFGAASILFWFLFFLFCLYAILKRFGRGLPVKAILSVFAILWVSGIGYFIVTKEPRPDHFEWVFAGEVYKTDWENVRLSQGTPPGTNRAQTLSIKYPVCLKPLSNQPTISNDCEAVGSIKIAEADGANFSSQSAAKIQIFLDDSAEHGSELAIDPHLLSRSTNAVPKVQQIEKANRRRYASSSSSSSGSPSVMPLTQGPVSRLSDMVGANGYRQWASSSQFFSYYFWPISTEQSNVEHWAICRETTDPSGGSFCTHFEIIGKRMYTYSVLGSQRNDWKRLRDSWIVMAKAQQTECLVETYPPFSHYLPEKNSFQRAHHNVKDFHEVVTPFSYTTTNR